MQRFLRLSILALCLSCNPGICPAIDPVRPQEEVRVTHWDQQNSLPQDSMWALAQTPEGFLWVACDEGFVGFDPRSLSCSPSTSRASQHRTPNAELQTPNAELRTLPFDQLGVFDHVLTLLGHDCAANSNDLRGQWS